MTPVKAQPLEDEDKTRSRGADETPPSPVPKPRFPVVPPSALTTTVQYPTGAQGDANVVLEFVVLPSGSVSDVRVIEGEEPFVSAALEAIPSWRFTPAFRAGRAVAARIRFLVKFEQVTKELPPELPEPSVSVPAPGEPPPSKPPLEVIVRGELTTPGTSSFTRTEARQLPGAFGDPLRTVEAMPGVTPVASGLPIFFIRGAPPGNVGFFIDGIRIPLLYHAFLGPSVIHPALIQKVELFGSAPPAQFGRYAGAVVTADLAEPEYDFRGEGNVRLFDAGALVEAPFASGKGSAIVGGRYSYTALLLSQLTDTRLEYWDYQGLLSYRVAPNHTLSVFAFGAYDFVGEGIEEDIAGTEFHRVDLRYDARLSGRTRARLAVTGGIDRTRSSQGFVKDHMLGVRTVIEHTESEQVTLRLGADGILDHYTLELGATSPERRELLRLFPSRDDLALGAYTEVAWAPDTWFSLTPGVRVDFYRSRGENAVGVDPRVRAQFGVAESVRIHHELGIAHQTPNFVPAIPGAQVGGLPGGLQRAVQSSAGVEFALPQSITLDVTAFQNAFFDLTDPIGQNGDFDIDETSAEERSLGHSTGLELQVKRSLTRRLGGFISYTLSRSTRSRERLASLSGFDRPHVLQTALSYDLGKRWRAGGRVAFFSGVPGSRVTPQGRRFDQDRAHPFFRLDLRLEKRWRLSESMWIAAFAEVLNTTLSREVIRRECRPSGCVDDTVGPITLPSIGVEAAF